MRKRNILTFLSLIIFVPSIMSCSRVVSQKIETQSQLPESEGTTQTRITSPYILEVADELSIQVWGFDDLKRTAVPVESSGEITYPLAGRIKVAGLTLPKAQEMIAARLKTYIKDPQVDVKVTTSQRQQIAVVGEVATPGMISYSRPLTVAEAVGKAGWFSMYANTSKVFLIRRANEKYNVYAVNTGDMFRDGSNVQQFYLQAGDMVYVPVKGIVKVERLLQHFQNIAQPFLTVEQAVVLWPAFIDAVKGKGTGTGLAISTPTTSGSSGPTPTPTTSTTSSSTGTTQ
jgi:polysaccharide biosynthesis/export protein